MIVVDASAIAELLLVTHFHDEIRSHIDGADLHAPALCDVEIASIFRSMILRRRLTLARAEEALAAYFDLPLTRHDHRALLPRILSLHRNFSPYDAAYVALCEALRARFVTGDRALARATRTRTAVAIAWSPA